ncbi:hypothetical protein KR054_011519 [Drosophila jambulina]|nr:hypothetical protein KR054_011519 [Drosophila jambulina]
MSPVFIVGVVLLCGLLQAGYCQANKSFTSADYCQSVLCHIHKRHIACNNKGNLSSKCPAGAQLVNLSALHDLILNEHNAYRNLLAGGKIKHLPQPQRMATLQWHAELEHLATLNVKQCALQYDPCHNTLEFRNSGQNLALINLTLTAEPVGNHTEESVLKVATVNQTDEILNKTVAGNQTDETGNKTVAANHTEESPVKLDVIIHTDESLIKMAIAGWWNQSVNVTATDAHRFPKGKLEDSARHFAVMARDNNTFVGCAALRFDKSPGQPHFLLACNYASDYICDWPLYKEKSFGCKSGFDLKYPFLCKAGEQYQQPVMEEETTPKNNLWI